MIGRAPKYDWDVIRALALGGMPLIEISRRLKVKHGTLVNRAFREKWKVRETFGVAKAEPVGIKRQELVKKLRQTTTEVIAENGVASRLHLSEAIRKGRRIWKGWKGQRWLSSMWRCRVWRKAQRWYMAGMSLGRSSGRRFRSSCWN